jgi:DnaK suppressor protein
MAQFALTRQQIEDLRQILRLQERQLRSALDVELHVEDASHTSIALSSSADLPIERMEADSMIARAERDACALAETIHALDKMATALFGACENCGEAIGYLRLLAYPTARRCLACQETAEASGAEK